ncbi:MAG: arylsulfatase [Burkholderiales bacterium]|nr:arylsulfatase [Burkholderiales bacterium]
MKIALIHALTHSIAPINEAFARDWPQARLMNLMDDSLSADLAASGGQLDQAMHARFESLASYVLDEAGAQAILFTCSAFGPCIEAVASRRPGVPVLKPNEAMIAQAAKSGLRVGLLASFAPTLASMPPEFPPGVLHATALAPGAMDALNAGDIARHDALVVEAALHLREQGCGAIALAQFSMAKARVACEQATGLAVLTTVDSAVAELRRRLA